MFGLQFKTNEEYEFLRELSKVNGKKFLVTAITCSALMLGFSGTSSASEITNDFSTLQVESQDLSRHWGTPVRHYPPHHSYQPQHHQGARNVGHGDTHHESWGNSGRNSTGSVSTRRSGSSVIVISRV